MKPCPLAPPTDLGVADVRDERRRRVEELCFKNEPRVRLQSTDKDGVVNFGMLLGLTGRGAVCVCVCVCVSESMHVRVYCV